MKQLFGEVVSLLVTVITVLLISTAIIPHFYITRIEEISRLPNLKNYETINIIVKTKDKIEIVVVIGVPEPIMEDSGRSTVRYVTERKTYDEISKDLKAFKSEVENGHLAASSQ